MNGFSPDGKTILILKEKRYRMKKFCSGCRSGSDYFFLIYTIFLKQSRLTGPNPFGGTRPRGL